MTLGDILTLMNVICRHMHIKYYVNLLKVYSSSEFILDETLELFSSRVHEEIRSKQDIEGSFTKLNRWMSSKYGH